MTGLYKTSQLDASGVAPIFKRNKWRKPQSIAAKTIVQTWHHGIYYGHGNKSSWIPLDRVGGIATKPCYPYTVAFPEAIEREMLAVLDAKKRQKGKGKNQKHRSGVETV